MGIISVEKVDSLYWLGRYSERVFSTLKIFYRCYDVMLDEDAEAYQEFCRQMGIPDVYGSKERFLEDYLYDKDNMDSVCTSISRAYGNAITLREEIGTTALSYIQMCMNNWQASKIEAEKYMNHQQMLDNLYAFWGCIDDEVEDEDHRNIIKAGRYVERLDLCIRMREDFDTVDTAYRRLHTRLSRLGKGYNDANLYRLGQIIAKKEAWVEDAAEALLCVNSLFGA